MTAKNNVFLYIFYVKIFSKTLTFAFLFIIFISNADAKRKVTIYFHPMLLLPPTSLFSMLLDVPFSVYLTTEIHLNPANSLIIQPSYRNYKFLKPISISSSDGFRIGSGVAVRHFTNGEGYGLYLQAMSGLYGYGYGYGSDRNWHKKGFYADLLGYIGYTNKENPKIFVDIGVGTVYPNPKLYKNNNFFPTVENILFENHLMLDVNFGIGYSF